MKRSPFLTLLPVALVAQTAAPLAPIQDRLRTEGPAIEQLVKELKLSEALERAKALLPTTVEPFDKEKIGGSYASYQRFYATARAYYLAATVSRDFGQWESALEYVKKARELSQENAVATKESLGKAIEAYKYDSLLKKGQIDGNADYIKWIKSLAKPTAEEVQQLESVKKMEEGLVNNNKWIEIFQKSIDHAEAEAKSLGNQVDPFEKMITKETDELANYKFPNDKVKYVEGIVSSKPYMETVKGWAKGDQLSFFNRLAVLDPSNKRVQKEIGLLTGQPVEEPAPTPKGKKKK